MFIGTSTHGTMQSWLTLANRANTIRRMDPYQKRNPTRTRTWVQLTLALSVSGKQPTPSARHLIC